jgi:hypothetical protein
MLPAGAHLLQGTVGVTADGVNQLRARTIGLLTMTPRLWQRSRRRVSRVTGTVASEAASRPKEAGAPRRDRGQAGPEHKPRRVAQRHAHKKNAEIHEGRRRIELRSPAFGEERWRDDENVRENGSVEQQEDGNDGRAPEDSRAHARIPSFAIVTAWTKPPYQRRMVP